MLIFLLVSFFFLSTAIIVKQIDDTKTHW